MLSKNRNDLPDAGFPAVAQADSILQNVRFAQHFVKIKLAKVNLAVPRSPAGGFKLSGASRAVCGFKWRVKNEKNL